MHLVFGHLKFYSSNDAFLQKKFAALFWCVRVLKLGNDAEQNLHMWRLHLHAASFYERRF